VANAIRGLTVKRLPIALDESVRTLAARDLSHVISATTEDFAVAGATVWGETHLGIRGSRTWCATDTNRHVRPAVGDGTNAATLEQRVTRIGALHHHWRGQRERARPELARGVAHHLVVVRFIRQQRIPPVGLAMISGGVPALLLGLTSIANALSLVATRGSSRATACRSWLGPRQVR